MALVRKRYKFTDKHNTKGGKLSAALGIIAIGMFWFALRMAFDSKGNGDLTMGIIGTSSFILSTIGLILGLSSFKEEDKFYLFSWIGTILCALMWILLCAIVVIGL